MLSAIARALGLSPRTLDESVVLERIVHELDHGATLLVLDGRDGHRNELRSVVEDLLAEATGLSVLSCARVGLTLDHVKVGGPLYQRALADQALLADLLPPPLFISGSNLAIHNMLEVDDAASLSSLNERLASNRAEFEARARYWEGELEGGALKTGLVGGSIPPAREFYALYDSQFAPALARGDKAKAAKVLAGPMRERK